MPEAPPTESSASTSGTPAANMVESVRVQRAMTALRIRSPNTGRYVDSTGYLQGKFFSLECKGISGKVVCFKVSETVAKEKTSVELQSWRPIFLDDLKKGRKSREIRDSERKNFHFEPIYFDYDKAEIRSEYDAFLKRIVYVVNSHSDLRVRVTGNTDADGSDEYNVQLSERRAQAIIDFFVKAGLKRDRIVIDFKG